MGGSKKGEGVPAIVHPQGGLCGMINVMPLLLQWCNGVVNPPRAKLGALGNRAKCRQEPNPAATRERGGITRGLADFPGGKVS